MKKEKFKSILDDLTDTSEENVKHFRKKICKDLLNFPKSAVYDIPNFDGSAVSYATQLTAGIDPIPPRDK